MGRKNQRPELFDLLNGKIENGQNVRVFFSNWTELDVWSYIEQQIEIPSIYFSQTESILERWMIGHILHMFIKKKTKKERKELFVLEQ
jgi:hypothetical protein